MTSPEVWKPIPGFSRYEVSNHGAVRSWRKKIRVWRKPDLKPGVTSSPKMLSGSQTENGYVAFILIGDDGRKKRMLGHRLVAITHIGPPPSKDHTDVAHNNGVPSDNRVENIRWATHRENQMDMLIHGTAMTGEKAPWSKLSAADHQDIVALKLLLRRGDQVIMAKHYGVSTSTISMILHERIWRH